MNPRCPVPGELGRRAALCPSMPMREGRVAAITDEMNEVRLWEQHLDLCGTEAIGWGVVAIARLPKARGIEPVKGAQPIADGERVSCQGCSTQVPRIDVEI